MQRDGFTFDYAGHFLHMRDERVKGLVARLLPHNLASIDRITSIRTLGVSVPYPFQAHLAHLPARAKQECLDGVIHRPARPVPETATLYDWSMATFGAGITRYFMKPYNEKLWTVSSRVLRADWCAPFVPRPTEADMRKSAAADPSRQYGYNARFTYFKCGGCQSLVNAFASRVRGVRYQTSSRRIDADRRRVLLCSGESIPYESLVSTQPLTTLIDQMAAVPTAVRAARRRLRWNTVVCYNIAVRLKDPSRLPAGGHHWVYFPEKQYPFYRVGVYSNIMPSMAPKGCASLYVEISYPSDARVNTRQDIAAVTRGLYESALLAAGDDIQFVQILQIPCAYVIFDKHRSESVATIQSWLASRDIHAIGRYGAWEYSFMEKNIVDGMETARLLNV